MVVNNMTLGNVFGKLRKYNKKNYYQLKFCIVFAVMLISSFISTVLNPAIQNVLPSGGDSRKMIYMIFAVAIIGCTIFTIYATRLFLRYSSREMGQKKSSYQRFYMVNWSKLVYVIPQLVL